MIDLKVLREKADWVRQGIAKKKFNCDLDAFYLLDQKRRDRVAFAEAKKAEQNKASDLLKQMEKGSIQFQKALEGVQALAQEVKHLELEAKTLEEEWRAYLLTIPNIPDESVPVGRTEADNIVYATWGDVGGVSAQATPHYDIENFSSLIDFPAGVQVTGAGFPFYRGPMAKLVRVLLQFFLEQAVAHGCEELLAPLLVNNKSALATGALPDKEGQMYTCERDGLYLIPTAEVPVTNLYRDCTLEERQLPIRHCAYTPCFRREAGSWGKEVRGLNRLHQFDKVEIVYWVHPAQSFEALETLRNHSESLLQALELPYRVLLICSGDMGFAHAKQYDLEVWAGGQKRWLEVSSCSNFTDFQARRAGTHFRPKSGGKSEYVHTLNGSALAIPRVLAAILENNYDGNGVVKIPKVLQSAFGSSTLVFK